MLTPLDTLDLTLSTHDCKCAETCEEVKGEVVWSICEVWKNLWSMCRATTLSWHQVDLITLVVC